ncbi:MAG: hypothetical protein EA398_09665 [Deltaproteobacteria bacterium]|nr:MAG: hypothetical protein EA398_09665 [Deltaproteobacteria bacterium]
MLFGCFAALTTLAGLIGIVETWPWRPDLVPAWTAMYLAILFFANAYRLSWGKRQWWRAFLRLLTTMGGVASAAFVHFAELRGGPVGVLGELVERPPSPAHHVAFLCVLTAGALLVLHAVFLGHGQRWRRQRRHRGDEDGNVDAEA